MNFDIDIARNCLECSGLAYTDNRAAFLKAKGFDLIAEYDRKNTQAFLAEKAGVLYLAYRGTQEFKDFFTDATYVKTDFRPAGGGGGRVHAGFFTAFKAVRHAVTQDLKGMRGRPLVTTGHSLGAALATMAALAFKAQAAYVFGSPRVGNEAFAARFDAAARVGTRKLCALYRFENRPDPVAMVPPATSPLQAYVSWRDGRPVTFYKHAGYEIKLSRPWHRFFRYRQSFAEYAAALQRPILTPR